MANQTGISATAASAQKRLTEDTRSCLRRHAAHILICICALLMIFGGWFGGALAEVCLTLAFILFPWAGHLLSQGWTECSSKQITALRLHRAVPERNSQTHRQHAKEVDPADPTPCRLPTDGR